MQKVLNLLNIDKEYCNAIGICDEELFDDEFDSDLEQEDLEFNLDKKEKLHRNHITDLSNKPFVDGEKDYEEVHKNLGRIPFSYIISGARDSGKTVTAHTLLKFYSSYMDIIHIWSPTASLDFKWGAVIEEYEIPKKNIHKNYSEILMKKLLKDIKMKNKNKQFKDKINLLFIFDDMITQLPKNKKYTAFNQLLLNNRHFNISIMVLSQSYHLLDSNLRKNASQLILYRTENLAEKRNYIEELSGLVGKDKFIALYDFATKDRHSFLYLNYHAPPERRFLKNFDQVLGFDDDIDESTPDDIPDDISLDEISVDDDIVPLTDESEK